MSLADVYNDWFGQEVEKTAEAEKVAEAEIEKIASIIDDSGLTEDECEKLAEVCDALDEEGYEFEEAEEKLAAAAEVLDALEGEGEGSEDERVAAEYDAAGRIMAQGFLDEIGVEEDTREAAGAGTVSKVLKAIKSGAAAGPKSVRSTGRLVKNLGPKQYAKSVLSGKTSGAKMTRRELAKALATLGAGGVAGGAAVKRMRNNK